jgi:F-type H+-transporting ATPase subunit epsilon
MRLRVFTPTEVILECNVIHVTLEDVTGSLGIRPGHADLTTPLVRCVLTARQSEDEEQYVAIDRGVLLVHDDVVRVATRQAVLGDDWRQLEDTVVERFAEQTDIGRAEHVAFEKMRLRFMRGLLDFEQAGRGWSH